MRAAFVICVLLALSCSVLAQAQKLDLEQPLQELMVSETVYPQEKHEVQLTLGTRIENEIGVVKSVSPLGLEYGITDSWQVGIEWDAYQWRGSLPSQRGTGDVEAETKFSFLNIRGSRNHAAVSFRLALPTGDAEQGLGEGTVEFQPSIILARDLGKRVQVFTQFGFGVSHRVAASADADRKVI